MTPKAKTQIASHSRQSNPQVPALLSVADIARLLSCSQRHVYRLSDAGRMPPPVRLGTLVRWAREPVEGWIADGYPRPTS
jgi:excisionase family DNA binding protein